MTTRTLAATAAPLPTPSPLDTPDRRAMLASAGAAAVLAAIGTPATASHADDTDAPLLALREPYERTLAVMDHFTGPHSRAEDTYFALRLASPDAGERALRKRSGLTVAERDYNRATRANLRVIDRIAKAPARTLAGVVFKAEVSRREFDMDPDLVRSIVTDLLALGSARPVAQV